MDTSVIQEKTMILILILTLLGCTNKEAKVAEQTLSEETKVIHSVTVDYFFSSNETKDKFKLTLRGKSALNGKVEFEILTSSGELIYKTDFESKALLDYTLNANAGDEEKSNYILKRMNEFFNDKHFIRPAIGSSETYDKDYNGIVSEPLWSELKNGSATGFYYLLWEGDQSWITFSKTTSKVVKYRKCC